MTIILVLLTFAFFIAVDVWQTSRKEKRARAEKPAMPPALEPVWVAGYQVPESLHYHRGHTWARPLDKDTVAVGLDDFARRLVGNAEKVDLPAVGDWLGQGDAAFTVRADGRTASLVAPVGGEVVEVNPELKRTPSLVLDDPFGRGWVMKIRPRKLTHDLRQLLNGSLARRFMEDTREALDLRLMALSGSVLQDGGEPVRDFTKHLDDADWRRLVAEFLLT